MPPGIPPAATDWLSRSGNAASIVGLFVALYTLYKVDRLGSALKRQSRLAVLTDLIAKIHRIPPTRGTIPDSNVAEVEFIVKTIRAYELSRFRWRHRALRANLEAIEEELERGKRRVVIQNFLAIIEGEIRYR